MVNHLNWDRRFYPKTKAIVCMNKKNRSRPAQVMTSDPDSFARYTVLKRFPRIVAQVIQDNHYPPVINKALAALQDEVAGGGVVSPLSDAYPNNTEWNRELGSSSSKSWLDLMWYFSEAFFYQRLLDIVQYFQPGDLQGLDPYQKQKREQVSGDIRSFASIWDQFEHLSLEDHFELILHSCLWGNRADLSMTSFIDGDSSQGLSTRQERSFILVDHTQQARAWLAQGINNIGFINDNIGADTLFDLVLADFLLKQGWAQQISFNLKDRPYFISDAMPQDIRFMISELQKDPNHFVQELGKRLANYHEHRQLILKCNAFWTSGATFEEMPSTVINELRQADFLILKGDANYRRLLGERHWPFATPMQEITQYFPFSFLALRTIKCEILAGLSPDLAQEMQTLDENDQLTFVNGKRGVIHLRILNDPV